jgi:nitrite reductase/ring-hydroxylating ferredoxin subunit
VPAALERFVRIARLADLDGVPFKAATLLGKRVAVLRGADGEIRALEMSCKHQGADLTAGKIEGEVVTCPRHGWRYDLGTGACLQPANGPPLRRHDVRVDGGDVHVSLLPSRPA